MQKEIKTINGNKFLADVEQEEEINVLEIGYIITPNEKEAECIKITGDHNVEFGNYINQYLENSIAKYYDYFESIQTLTSLNHVVYGGLRIQDINNAKKNCNVDGLCNVFLPNNLTDGQKKALQILRFSNRSVINPDKEKVLLNFFRMTSQEPLSEEEIESLLKSDNKIL